jgi:hypothetical protein
MPGGQVGGGLMDGSVRGGLGANTNAGTGRGDSGHDNTSEEKQEHKRQDAEEKTKEEETGMGPPRVATGDVCIGEYYIGQQVNGMGGRVDGYIVPDEPGADRGPDVIEIQENQEEKLEEDEEDSDDDGRLSVAISKAETLNDPRRCCFT